MCNLRKRKILVPLKLTLWASCIVAATCIVSTAQAQTPITQNSEWIVTGPYLALNLQQVELTFEEARITQSLRSGKRVSLTELVTYPQRHQVLVSQLQNQAIAKSVDKRPSNDEYYRILSGLGEGIRLNRILSEPSVNSSTKTSESILAKRYQTTPTIVRQIIIQQWKRHSLAEMLFDKLPPGFMLVNWFQRNVQLKFSAISIPRVPTSAEIDAAIQTKKDAIRTVYEGKPQRFVKPAKIVAQRVLVPWRAPRTPTDDEWVRAKVKELRTAAIQGKPMEMLVTSAGFGPDQRKGGRVTLRSGRFPDLKELAAGEVSSINEDKLGVFFFKVLTHIPVFERKLTDTTVQRELAAELLRNEDELPTAKAQALRAATILSSTTEAPSLDALNVQGARAMQPKPFAPFADALIPGVGTSEDASNRLKRLRDGEVTEQPILVRQDYVVFRADKWILPDLNEWWQSALTEWPIFVQKAKGQLIEQWLARRLPKAQIKMDGKAITNIKFEK